MPLPARAGKAEPLCAAQVSGREPSWARSRSRRSVDHPPTWNTAVAGMASRAPAAERTPEEPAGIRMVTSAAGPNGPAGVHTMAPPGPACHLPAIAGLKVGSRDADASAAEKTTRTGSAAVTGSALLPGAIDSTSSGAVDPVRPRLAP